ncbi:flap endonuclease 1 [Rhizoclosmatium globosum]|uniref:Flap endonuclease 1 n=1 Tax=Rhizoclosmatium globosum TaxID=329046 RepID=A0A1Y2C1W5_9FUNG|nr:flap endonuclease 1 [Rhizoclosmatium globosum]|eukprot:ORY41033.1 flap endonuclease 1 [Rhizoclosmatium globosum]
MGIHGLSKVIAEHAPGAIKELPISNCFGRKVAIDASMSIYQFLIAVRQQDGMQLTNEAGETTSHLMGMLYRTVRMFENGIKPVYVFDGKPPDMKSNELKKRGEKREGAEKAAAAAEEAGDAENFDKFSRRTVKVTKEHNEECRRLLKLMGVPYIEAPCEAEAQCASLAKSGKVYAAGSEDMDTLTFGTPVLMRHLTFSEARKMPVMEIELPKVLEGLGMTMDQFIDMCILLGCDYCDSIKGIGPTRAVSLIKEHKNIETILKHIDTKKYAIPEDWPYKEARELFKTPSVTDAAELDVKWEAPDEEGVVKYLVGEKGFNEDRVRSAIQKLIKTRTGTTQGRLADYFKPVGKPAGSAAGVKRKPDAKAASGPAKKKGGSFMKKK